MRKMVTLINREFWEQRGVFFTTPMILAGILALVAVAVFILSLTGNVDTSGIAIHMNNDKVAAVIPALFASIASPFVLILWFIVFYYFLGSLYDDRKDGSILFWQSMPISQTQTIISKLIAGLILAPFCTWVVVMVAQLFILCVASLFLIIHPIVNWSVLWSPSVILLSWLRIFGAMLLQAVWLLPLLAWCMLCSAFSKKAPALRALVPIVVIVVLEMIFLSRHYVTDFIFSRFSFAAQTWYNLSANYQQLVASGHEIGISKHVNFHFQKAGIDWVTMVIGIAISIVCLCLAGWFRSRCYDFEK